METEVDLAVLSLEVGDGAFQGHGHSLDDVTIHHLAGDLVLDTGNTLDLDLTDHPSAIAAVHGHLILRLDGVQGECKAIGVGVGPEVVVVEIERVAGEGDPLPVAQADGLQSEGAAAEEVAFGTNMADSVAEAGLDLGVNVDTCDIWNECT